MARNKVNENFIKELMGIDSPIKIFTSMGNILKFLDQYLEDINKDFEGLENDKGNIYGLLYDLLDDRHVSIGMLFREGNNINPTGGFKRGFFKQNDYEKFIVLNEFEQYKLVLNYYGDKDTNSNLNELKIIENEGGIQFELESKAKGKYYSDFADEYRMHNTFNPRYMENEYYEVFLSQKIKELLNFEEFLLQNYKELLGFKQKDSKQNKSELEKKKKEVFLSFLVKNMDNPKIVDLLKDYREMLIESQIQSVMNDRMKQFNDKLKEVYGKVALIKKLKNLQIILNNLNNTIFASIIFSYIVNKVKIYKNIDYSLIEKIILTLDSSQNNNHGVKRFFKQLNDKTCEYPRRIFTWILQNLFVILLFIITLFLLPPFLIILFIVFFILTSISNEIKSDFLLYRINAGFRLLIILVGIFSFMILGTVYHFDNIKSVNTTINKLFLKNTQEYILGTDKNENCYNYNYFKKGKSCFEE